jgi:hypothetical protein
VWANEANACRQIVGWVIIAVAFLRVLALPIEFFG